MSVLFADVPYSLSVRPVLSTLHCLQAERAMYLSPDNEFGFSIVAYSSSCAR